MILKPAIDYLDADPAAGPKCPSCGGATHKVVETRKAVWNNTGIYVRRRKCVNCKTPFRTVELPEDMIGQLIHLVRQDLTDHLAKRLKGTIDDTINSFEAYRSNDRPRR